VLLPAGPVPDAEVDMDDRQTKIREGAGLEDSRINKEFLDFLNKWSSPVLIVLAIAALTWAGMQKLEQMRSEKVDKAFGEYETLIADGNPSPSSLKSIATEYEDVRSVAHMARLREVDLYLGAAALGLEPGAQIDQATQSVASEDDILSDEKREQYRDLAASTAQQVLDATVNEPGKEIFALQALSRLASVEESRADFEAAKSRYERLVSLAEEHNYPTIVTFAQKRIESLDSLAGLGELPTNAQVPSLTPGLDLPSLPTAPDAEPEVEQQGEDEASDATESPAADSQDPAEGEPEGTENP